MTLEREIEEHNAGLCNANTCVWCTYWQREAITLEIEAHDAYETHQHICGATHRPRGYRCNLASPFTYGKEGAYQG